MLFLWNMRVRKPKAKVFNNPVVVQDFPLRGKKVFLNIRRRRWLLKPDNSYISRDWRILAADPFDARFCVFFKSIILIAIR